MDGQLLLQSLLVGVFCYLGAIETPWLLGMTGGFYLVGRPLIAGFIIGLIFGDVQTGILCGLAVQAVFIANLSTGGATNSEITYAGYGGIGIAMATTKDPALAVTLSVVVGQTFGLIFYNFRMAVYSYWNRRFDRAVENLSYKGILFNQVIGPQITTFLLRAIPIMILIYLGRGFVDLLISNMPQTILHIISVLGGVLPALGIGMLMTIIIKEKSHLIFFLGGFVFIAFLKINMIGLVFIAMLISYLVYLSFDSKKENAAVQDDDYDEVI